jgi:hypothetical protein
MTYLSTVYIKGRNNLDISGAEPAQNKIPKPDTSSSLTALSVIL